MTDYQKGYTQALEDINKRVSTYYGYIDNTQGLSVKFYIVQIITDLKRGLLNYERL